MPDEAKPAHFAEIYAACARDVYRFALYLSGDAALAEDITSETFLRAFLSAAPARPGTVKAWLLAIARNLYRHERRRAWRTAPLEDAAAPAGTLAAATEAREELAHVRRLLSALPQTDRAALLLRAVEGLSYQEIAALLRITVAAAKVKVHRARLRLAKGARREVGR